MEGKNTIGSSRYTITHWGWRFPMAMSIILWKEAPDVVISMERTSNLYNPSVLLKVVIYFDAGSSLNWK